MLMARLAIVSCSAKTHRGGESLPRPASASTAPASRPVRAAICRGVRDLPCSSHQAIDCTNAAGKVFARSAAEERAAVGAALDAAAAGRLRPRIHAVFPLEDAPAAHTELEQRRSIGAVLLAL